jgi:hypothetical protein
LTLDVRWDPEKSPVLRVVEPGERVHAMTQAEGAHLLVTDRRIVVGAGERVALDIAFPGLRRIQFDIERRRPATLVIVPEDPLHEPQVLAIPPQSYDDVTAALARIGHRLVDTEAAS